MDDDDRLYLAENISVSNTDDDEIDSDLEDKLYAAVFHSNDISSNNEETHGYNNVNTLKDVIGSWKNIPDKNNSVNLQSTGKYVDNILSEKHYPENSEGINVSTFKKVVEDSRTENRYDERTDIIACGNRVKEPFPLDNPNKHNEDKECLGNNRTCDVFAYKEPEIEAYKEEERVVQTGTIRKRNTIEDIQENAFSDWKGAPVKNMMKKHKNSPKKLSKPRDSPLKSLARNDTPNYAYSQGENTSTIDFAPEDETESSEIKAKEELEKNESIQKEDKGLHSVDIQTRAVEEVPDRPPSIKPEEEFEKAQSTDREVVEKRSHEAEEVEPKEAIQLEKVDSMENEAKISSSDSSSSDSSSEDSSSSSVVQVRQDSKRAERNEKTLNDKKESNEVIELDDSEGSICEIPVPPKPRPPTINLDDSDSSTSSEDDTSSEEMSPQKLVESYRMAVSKSNSLNQRAGVRTESIPQNERERSRETREFTSDSDDSMTESEEENWGIIAGSRIDRDQPTFNSIGNVGELEIICDLTTDIEQPVRSCMIIEDGNKTTDLVSEGGNRTTDLVSEGGKSPIRESRRESLTGCSEIGKKSSGNLTANNSLGIQNQEAENERLSPSRVMVTGNDRGKKNQGNNDDDTLIINAENSGSFLDLEKNRESVTSTRSPENRKRSVNGSGKKSKHQSSPKKCKNSDDSAAAAGSSSNKSLKENKENKDKERNCAANYFSKPMNNEMANYYNKSWGGEDFDIDAIRRQMPNDQRHWAILNEDLHGYQQRRSRYWVEGKCRNCNRTGHYMADCPEKRKVPSCHMCGTPGHKEPRCPHKMCLGCGRKQKTYMQVCKGCRRARCNGCQSYGHVEDYCPDLWRRYHATTSYRDPNTQLSVDNVMKPSHLLSCCNCARRGHDSTTCDSYRWSRHFPTPSYVTNYDMGPIYTEEPSLEDVGFPSEAREQNEMEKRYTDDEGVAHIGSSSNEGSKKKLNTDKVTNENSEVDECLQVGSKDVAEAEKQSKEGSKSNEEKTRKSNEVVSTNCESSKEGQILLSLKSQLLDNNFEDAANFGECTIPLFAEQYEKLIDSDLSREFLLNLTSQFPIKLEIKRCRNGGTAIFVSSTKDLHFPMQLTIMDWLKWPLDERSRFVKMSLPTTKGELVKLLSAKLEELNQNLGDPFKLYSKVKSLKKQLASLQNQSKAGKKSSTCSKRARIVEQLARSQCRLNMILFGQVKLRKSVKSYKFLKNALSVMQKTENPSYICAAIYLQMVHHYNIIFAAYTPENLPELLDLYWQRYNQETSSRKKKKPNNIDAVYSNFIRSLNKVNKHQESKSSKLAGSKGSSNTRNQVLPRNVNADREGSDSAINADFNCNGVEGQFVIPETCVNDTNHNLQSNFNPIQHPLIYDLDIMENNYYNSLYDFPNNSGSQRHKAYDTVQRNHQQEDYIALDNRNFKNQQYNMGRDFSNVGGDFSRRSRRYVENSTLRNRMNNRTGNEFENVPRTDYMDQSNAYFERNRWQEGYASRSTISSQDMFFSDTRAADSSQNYLRNDTLDVFATNGIEGRNRYNESGPSTSTSASGMPGINSTENPSPCANQRKNVSNKSKKKRRNRGGGPKLASKYLQKRAAKNIAKYIDSGYPRITQAANELQKKLSDKDLTLQCIRNFEGLVKRKLRKTDYLL